MISILQLQCYRETGRSEALFPPNFETTVSYLEKSFFSFFFGVCGVHQLFVQLQSYIRVIDQNFIRGSVNLTE